MGFRLLRLLPPTLSWSLHVFLQLVLMVAALRHQLLPIEHSAISFLHKLFRCCLMMIPLTSRSVTQFIYRIEHRLTRP